MKRSLSIEEKALIKAAKLICNLKSGICPIHEPDFFNCPHACTEDTLPWQCWVIYLTAISRNTSKPQSKKLLSRAA